MPEDTQGRLRAPLYLHTEQSFRNAAVAAEALARLENGQAVLAAAIAQLSTQLGELSQRIEDAEREAEDIIRRAASPTGPAHPSPASRGRRRGDTILRVVQAVVIVALGLGVILAACDAFVPHARSGRCAVACARAVPHHPSRRRDADT